MKLNLKDRPAEWRKSALLSVLGLAVISSLLAWRHIISKHTWLGIMVGLAVLAIVAALRPRWFRGYHLLSMRIGFFVSRWLGRFLLAMFFLFILTPVGWALRLADKDPLRLKRPANTATYWQDAKEPGALDRLF